MDLTYILPISGEEFPRYITFFSVLSKTPLRPSLILCASGGCVVSYLGMMSDFEENIEEWKVSGKLFAYKVIPIAPRLVTLLMTGSLYRRPNINDYIRENFIPGKLKNVEIVTGYYSNTKQRVVLSSNMDASGFLSKEHFDLTNADVEHNDGKLEPILKSIEGTTNIPYMLPAFASDKRIDYGVHSPSPLTFLKHTSSRAKKVIYFAPTNIEKTYDSSMSMLLFINMIQTEITRLSSSYHSFVTYHNEVPLSHLIKLDRFLLVIYTTVEVDMDIASFASCQVDGYVKLMKKDVRYRLYH